MYTFREDPRGIIVISGNGYEIPWGRSGIISEETYRLCALNEELADEFEEWFDMTQTERVIEKEDFFDKRKSVPAPTLNELCVDWQPASQEAYYTMNIFSTFSANPFSMLTKKEEENMNTRFEDTQEGKAQAHVIRRADNAFHEKDGELMKHYGLHGDGAPRTWNELVKRIKDGRFKISDEHAKMNTYGSGTEYVEWRDPKIEKDHEGYDKSKEKLMKLLAETKDVIIVKSAADGLEMIEKIQNFKH